MMQLTASQIRQDLNCFGGFGQQGYGYNVAALHKEIGNVFMQVLEDSGVYKRNEEGQAAFDRFIAALND